MEKESISIKTITTKSAPAAIGPYVQGMTYENLVFTSGQIALHPESGEIPTGIEAQVRLAVKNAEAILLAAGSSLQKAVKVNIFLTDMDDFLLVNQVYEELFIASYPCRSCVEVSRLPAGANVEIEIIAAK